MIYRWSVTGNGVPCHLIQENSNCNCYGLSVYQLEDEEWTEAVNIGKVSTSLSSACYGGSRHWCSLADQCVAIPP